MQGYALDILTLMNRVLSAVQTLWDAVIDSLEFIGEYPPESFYENIAKGQ